tara:strand:- start:135 stop:809 length:675 start_codon:yes stop_codon:yes gene_type:complete
MRFAETALDEHDHQPELVLIRGILGSGKSTLAKAEFPSHTLVETDQFFAQGGEYQFDPKLIGKAHTRCQELVESALRRGESVVVANTFFRFWELKQFIGLGWPVRIVEATGRYQSIHDVPPETVQRMRDRYEKGAHLLICENCCGAGIIREDQGDDPCPNCVGTGLDPAFIPGYEDMPPLGETPASQQELVRRYEEFANRCAFGAHKKSKVDIELTKNRCRSKR